MHSRKKISAGDRYGNLTVLSSLHKKSKTSGRKRLHWLCACDCGKLHEVDCGNLRNGNTHACPSCAAKKRAQHRKKPFQNHRVKSIRRAMIDRCTNKNNRSYPRYGGSGVKVCERWLDSLENFVEDMGLPPDGMSIDRIDPFGNYEPSNCRWADIETQANNKKKTVKYTYQGKTMSLSQWCKELGLKYDRVKNRINVCGMAFDVAIAEKKLTQRKVYKTPDGVFNSLEMAANYYGMTVSGVFSRFKSNHWPDWVSFKVDNYEPTTAARDAAAL